MFNPKKLLVTGGSGLLGSAIKKLIPRALYPSSKMLTITNYRQMDDFVRGKHISQILHLAAFTSPPKVENEPQKALDVNIIGTANVVKLCMKNNVKLIYVSTDYVFSGKKGIYSEEDPVYPVNKYAWSKLGGECAARLYDNSLIIRTSFGPKPFPYDVAFTDQWTSRETVDTVAQKIVKIIDSDIRGVIHIGGRRISVYEYAKKISPRKIVNPISRRDVKFTIPSDTSLNTSKYDRLFSSNRIAQN